MNIFFASSEITPFASSGGLGDVAAALPKALQQQGVTVQRVMPLYRHVWESGLPLHDTELRLDIPVGHDLVRAEIWLSEHDGVSTYFVRRDEYFDRRELYSLPERDYDDNFARFVFFQKAAVALLDELGVTADIVHCNDWQTGLIPLYLKHGIDGLGRNGRERTVFTIHNLAYQGIFPGTSYFLTSLPLSALSFDGLEYYGSLNCMKGGLVFSDAITTVSTSYAREIRTAEHGCGLEGLLTSLKDRLHGIVNGIDYTVWDPESDPFLANHYSAADPAHKRQCKAALLREMRLPLQSQTPLLGMISRLADQKGLDLLAEAMPELMSREVQFVLLGSGEKKYHAMCRDWTKRWPRQFAARIGFDTALAHRIEAGADIFLMPSRFEPCGLNQMYSMRYGTLPLVHATGGLKDTVEPTTPAARKGTGFLFEDYRAEALLEAVDAALSQFRDPPKWKALMKRAMLRDSSWENSAGEYIKLYERVLQEPEISAELK